MLAASGQQGTGLVGVETGGDHQQGTDTEPPALPGDLCDVFGGHGDHREVGDARQGAHGRVGADAEDRPRRRVDRIQGSREPAGGQVVQDRPAHRAGPATRPDDRDAPGTQQRHQAGHVRGLPAPLDAAAVLLRVVQGDHAVHFRPLEPAFRTQTQVGEDLEHLVVLGERVRGERPDAVGAGGGDQMLQQQRAHSAVVASVADRERDLRAVGRLPAARLVLGYADDPASALRDERPVAGALRLGDPRGGLLGGAPAHGEEAQPQVRVRHRRVQPEDGLPVVRPRGPYAHRRAVGEEGVHPFAGCRDDGHGMPFVSGAALSASASRGREPMGRSGTGKDRRSRDGASRQRLAATAHPQRRSPRTTATGQCAWCSTAWLTDPSSSPANPPRPRVPTTTS